MGYISALVHLSDIECGEHNRANVESWRGPYQKCAEALVADLKEELSNRRGFSGAQIGLIITGDVASTGAGPEFENAATTIELIRDSLKIPPEQVAVVPGNHDVNWIDCEKAFRTRYPDLDLSDPKSSARARDLPQKLGEFGRFFQRVCRRPFNGPESVTPFREFARLGIALVGLDTTHHCTFCKEDNYGFLRGDPVIAARNELDSMLRENERLVPVAAMHHCPNPLADQVNGDNSYLHNATEAIKWLREAGFYVVLCGHEHRQSARADLRTKQAVFATGSYGLDEEGLRTRYLGHERRESNRYQIVLLDPEGNSEFLLRKLRIPGSVESDWVEDTDGGSSRFPVHLTRYKIEEILGLSRAQPVFLFVSHPFEIRRQRWVVSLSLGGVPDSLKAISSVTYSVGGVPTRVCRNRDVGFRTDVEVDSISKAQVKVELTLEGGEKQTVTRNIPPPP